MNEMQPVTDKDLEELGEEFGEEYFEDELENENIAYEMPFNENLTQDDLDEFVYSLEKGDKDAVI